MITIYKDQSFEDPLDSDVLWEGTTYFLDLATFSELERDALIDQAKLRAFSTFDRRNPVASFALRGFVGTLEIEGRKFDVRSRKLAINEPGEAQFAALLREIDAIIAGLIFRYASPTFRQGAEESSAHLPTALERLDFFLPRMDGPDVGTSIFGTVQRIISNPHHAVRSLRQPARIESAKRLDVPALIKQVGRSELIAASGSSERTAQRLTRTNLLPRFVPTISSQISYDTAENRFVRFFLQDIEAVCLSVLRDKRSSQISCDDARKVLARVRELLAEPFFREIGRLQNIPGHSPVLMGNEAYNRLYHFYLRSRLGVVDPLTSARQQMRFSPLKDIASLYEIWAFFKLADTFLDKSSQISVQSISREGLTYGTTWRSGNVAISYNRTFASKRGSYSVTLRPDVSLEIGDRLWLFDAKYKSDQTNALEEDDQLPISAAVKKIDLHKMHTYVDAISNAHAAIAVYPGTEISFFPRDRRSGSDLEDLGEFGGIGGIPLLPLGSTAEIDRVKAALALPS